MDEAWERAVEAALDGQAAVSSSSSSSPRTLTLDGAVKCLHGRLPPPSLFEKFQSLEHLSIANIGVSSLEKFPRLRNLRRLILSDNRIAGGLEFLVEAGLDSLRDLDLSNNRIQFLEDLAPLAQLQLVSLDLYECPVTRVKDYRSRVFGMIRSLKYLDKMDADENERPESDEEEEDDDDEEEEDEIDGDDPGSGEIDGENQGRKAVNSVGGSGDGVVDVDEDESDADEEETETGSRRVANGFHQHHSNGFRLAAVGEEVDEDVDDEEDEEYDEEDGDDDEMGEEIDADDGEDEDVVEVHDVVDNDDNEDGVQEEEDDDEVDDEDYADEDEVEDEEEEGEPVSAGRVTSAEGEIDGHEQGEEDENGELGEADVEGVEEELDSEDDDGDEEEDVVGEYLVQPIPQPERAARGHDDSDACDEDEEEVNDEDNRPSIDSIPSQPSSSSQHKSKRKRDNDSDLVDDSVKDLRYMDDASRRKAK